MKFHKIACYVQRGVIVYIIVATEKCKPMRDEKGKLPKAI